MLYFFNMLQQEKISKKTKTYVLQIIRKHRVAHNTTKTKISLIFRVPFYIKKQLSWCIIQYGRLMILTVTDNIFSFYLRSFCKITKEKAVRTNKDKILK